MDGCHSSPGEVYVGLSWKLDRRCLTGVPNTHVLLLAHRHTMIMNTTVAIINTTPVASPAITGRVKALPDVGGEGGDEDGMVVVVGAVEMVSGSPSGDVVT